MDLEIEMIKIKENISKLPSDKEYSEHIQKLYNIEYIDLQASKYKAILYCQWR